jgi:hypothetical protein
MQNPKPPIAAKPKITQKTNVVIVGSDAKTKKEQCSENFPLVSQDANHFSSLPSSPPNISDCANDCCGILHNKQLECMKNNKNGSYSNGASTDEENDSDFRKLDHKTFVEQLFKTSSQSFDSSSSSSGGFKDYDYVTKTKVAYETFDKEDQVSDEPASYQVPIGNSKVQEMKSKLLAQQQQQQQNHSSNEPSIVINRQKVQKSSRELEKVLGLRIDKNPQLKVDKSLKRMSKSFEEGSENVAAISSQIGANISMQIQKKLTEEMKQQCEMIKEKFLIEKVPVQQHYSDFMVHDVNLSFSFFAFWSRQ